MRFEVAELVSKERNQARESLNKNDSVLKAIEKFCPTDDNLIDLVNQLRDKFNLTTKK